MKTAEGRKRLAGAARSLWQKNRTVPLVRAGIGPWVTTRRGRSAGSRQATGLVQPSGRGAPFLGVLHGEKAGAAKAQGNDG